MSEGITCYERDETLCEDGMCLRVGCRLRNERLAMTDHAKELLALAELRAANETRQKEWDALGQLTLAYRGNELAGEVGEACNVIKKLERERLGIAGSRDTTAHLAEELADVIICTDLIAMQAGIDLDAAVVAKFNASSEKVGLKTRLSTRQQASVELLALKLAELQGNTETAHDDDAHALLAKYDIFEKVEG